MTDPAFEARVRAVLDLMPAPLSPEQQILQVVRVRATLAEADAAKHLDEPTAWPEPEGAFGLGRDMPCLAQAIRD